MSKFLAARLFAFCLMALAVPALFAQDSTDSKAGLLEGPATARLGDIAEIKLPAGYVFLDGKTTQAMLKKEGEPVSGRELGFLHPTNENWAVFFEFNDIGYVKDDDKEVLKNPDKLLNEIIKGNDEANKERVSAGRPPLEIVGWEVPPQYNETTHNLEWAIRATVEGKPLLNYNTKLLGRRGVMETVLVVEPEDLQGTLPEFRTLLADYKYEDGQKYAQFVNGDKIAEYGLAGLIVGGAAVGAAKLGLLGPLIVLFKKAWYLVVAAIAAVVKYIKRGFNALFGRPDKKEEKT